MSHQDKIKWDKKYQENFSLFENREASDNLIKNIDKVSGKKALDVACGTGRNSIFLAKNGFEIDALDISHIALDTLKSRDFQNISCRLVDLDNCEIVENYYDLIVMTNFLDRNIIPKLKNALKAKGILFIETYMEDEMNEKTSSNPNFLLKKGELKTFFNDKFEILEYDEFFNDESELRRMKKQFVIAKKI